MPWPPAFSSQNLPRVHAACAVIAPRPHASPARISRPASHALLSTRQAAWAFNQPLSWDTSSVTNMYQMFRVHTARALSPAFSRALPVCMPLASPPPHVLSPHGPHLNPPTSNARLSTRQGANAFNQPLAFDTSKVTNMNQMFVVRSARALAPSLGRALTVHAACAAAALCPSRLPGRTSHCFVCPPFDSAASVCVQPAAGLRHVQGHNHEHHVRGAPCACPGPQP